MHPLTPFSLVRRGASTVERLSARFRIATARLGSQRHCVYCDSYLRRFLPYREGSAGLSDFLRMSGYNTGCLDDHACPICGIGDRERHLIMYFDALGLWAAFEESAILHFAPESRLRERIRASAAHYIAADLHPSDPETLAMDVMSIDAPDGAFDIVICNHVLEHVPDVRMALSEISRVLAPSGFAVLQTPYATRLQQTFTDPLIDSDAGRRYYYGQEDHARLFGRDIFDQIAGAGLSVVRIEHNKALAAVDARREGVGVDEDLILAEKTHIDALAGYDSASAV